MSLSPTLHWPSSPQALNKPKKIDSTSIAQHQYPSPVAIGQRTNTSPSPAASSSPAHASSTLQHLHFAAYRTPTSRTSTQSTLATPTPLEAVAATGVTKALRDNSSVLEDSVGRLEAGSKIRYAPAEELDFLSRHHRLRELSQLRQLVHAPTDGTLADGVPGQTLTASTVEVEADEPPSERDSVYNHSWSRSGCLSSAQYSDVGSIPSASNSGGWTLLDRAVSRARSRMRVLRPDFGKSWTQNTLTWRVELIGFARVKILQLYPLLAGDYMQSKYDEELTEKLSTVYKTLKAKQNKLSAAGTNAVAPPRVSAAPATTDLDNLQLARRLGRKKRKLQTRRKILHDPKIIRVYMSTDGSGDEAEESKVTIDPDSDDGHKPRTRKQIAWTTRPPMYRSHILRKTIDDLDRFAAQQPATPGTASHPRIQGAKMNVPLPRLMRKPNAVRIPLAAIDRAWLDDHREEVMGLRDEDAETVKLHWKEVELAEVDVGEHEEDTGVYGEGEEESEE
ncbi:hypothetical protein EV122DRAFT_285236 [Schizophyllum commune]